MSDEFENDDLTLDGREEEQDFSDEYGQDDYEDTASDGPDANDGDYADEGDDSARDDGAYDDYYDDGGTYDDTPREPASMKREWANSIVTNKRVKREELRRKVKKAMLFMLVFALIVTSIVYIMLLFIQENNVRITASSQNNSNSISLSFDNNYWTPYLNAQGPTEIWNVSYSTLYDHEKIDTIDDVYAMLRSNDFPVGTNNGENFIRFTFMLRNNGNEDVSVDYEMTLDNDRHSGLQNAVRVMWGESFKNPDYSGEFDPDDAEDPTRTVVTVYASLSNNPRLANTGLNVINESDEGYQEYVAYPVGSDNPSYDWMRDFGSKLDQADGMTTADAMRQGFLQPTTPFEDGCVFRRTAQLTRGDIMYCYVCIWLEGSDFDCVDSALGGYVRLGINFVAYS